MDELFAAISFRLSQWLLMLSDVE